MTTFERTELVRTGRSSDVYRGRCPEVSFPIAVRVLKEAEDHEYARRYARQAQIISGIVRHPGIVKVYDVVDEGQQQILLTELLEGETLRERLRRGRIPQAQALEVTRMVLSTLAAAHKAGFVHHDLRPEHVFLQGLWNVKVTDFSVMRPDSGRIGPAVGNPRYMSPEQNSGQASGVASDIYAVGLMLYEMLAGTLPFEGESSAEVLRQQRTYRPQGLPGGTPRFVKGAVARALASRPEDRFASAEAFLRALKGDAPESRVTSLNDTGRASADKPPKPPAAVTRKASPAPVAKEMGNAAPRVGPGHRPDPVRAPVAMLAIFLICLVGLGIGLVTGRHRSELASATGTGATIPLRMDGDQPVDEPIIPSWDDLSLVEEPPAIDTPEPQPEKADQPPEATAAQPEPPVTPAAPVARADSLDRPDQERTPPEDALRVKPAVRTKTPVSPIVFRKEVKRIPIPFGTVVSKTSSLAAGEKQITRQGRPGERVITWRIGTRDGKPVSRKKLRDDVSRRPVARLVTEGTGQEDPSVPPPPRPPMRPKRPAAPTAEQQQQFERDIAGYGVALQRWRVSLDEWQNATGITAEGSDPLDQWRKADRERRRRAGQR